MAGGISSVDDARIKPGEIVWRLIPVRWYQPDPNIPGSPLEVPEHAFSGDVSILRKAEVSQTLVDAALNGQFVKWGILELHVDDVRAVGCVFEFEVRPEWPAESHFLIRRIGQNNQLQRLNNTQKHALSVLANANPLLRVPQP